MFKNNNFPLLTPLSYQPRGLPCGSPSMICTVSLDASLLLHLAGELGEAWCIEILTTYLLVTFPSYLFLLCYSSFPACVNGCDYILSPQVQLSPPAQVSFLLVCHVVVFKIAHLQGYYTHPPDPTIVQQCS